VNIPRRDGSITLVRHGESTWNQSRLIQGHNNAAKLTQIGREQAREVAETLRSLEFDQLITSDLARAYETASIIGDVLNLAPVADSLLRERCFGVLEGEPSEMLDSASSGIIDDVLVDPDARPSGGESFRDVVTRAGIFLDALRDSLGSARVLVVTHGGTIRALRAYVDGPPLEGLDAFEVSNCSVWNLYPSSVD
jgi:broad specificity phosphatase PhoE